MPILRRKPQRTGEELRFTPRLGTWDRVWCQQPSDARDDELLSRERLHPRWSWITNLLRAQLGDLRGLKTIELGSGRGDWSALLAQVGAEVTLLDSNHLALGQAERRFRRIGLSARYVRGDLFELSEELSGRFDVALSSGVIEHFQGRERSESIRAHLAAVRPGGIVVISVPHAWSPSYRMWKGYLELRGWWPYGYEQPYTVRELRQRARSSGLSQPQFHCFGFWQSVGDHLGKGLIGRGAEWSQVRSRLDAWGGSMLVMVAQRPTNVN